MGSKTYEGQHPSHESSDSRPLSKPTSGKPRGQHFPEDGDGNLGQGDDDDGDDDAKRLDSNAPENIKNGTSANTGKKKKRKKTKKKKKNPAPPNPPAQQTSPPRVPLSCLFSNNIFPKGEFLEYEGKDDNMSRTTGAELRYTSRLYMYDEDWLNNYRKAGEVHRQVRNWVQQTVKPGQSLTELAVDIEDGVRALLGHQGIEPGDSLKAGMGFPTGLALNSCAAHFTPNPGQKDIVLRHDDVMKVDFGVHIGGWIVDSAFTVAFDPTYDNLLAAVKDATNAGIRSAGIDARMSEIGSAIQEAMESYEVEIGRKTYPVKAIRNITGHDIQQYRIHGGKSVPFIKNSDETKMEEGEIFAIETFGSTGRGYLRDDVGVYGYGRDSDAPFVPLHLSSARSLLKAIDENFGTIVFCRRYLERIGIKNWLLGMSSLISNGIVNTYAPLVDVKGSYTAQFEHTILLRQNGVEVVSRGDDY